MHNKIAVLKDLHNSIFDRYYQVDSKKLLWYDNVYFSILSKIPAINKPRNFLLLMHEKYYLLICIFQIYKWVSCLLAIYNLFSENCLLISFLHFSIDCTFFYYQNGIIIVWDYCLLLIYLFIHLFIYGNFPVELHEGFQQADLIVFYGVCFMCLFFQI